MQIQKLYLHTHTHTHTHTNIRIALRDRKSKKPKLERIMMFPVISLVCSEDIFHSQVGGPSY